MSREERAADAQRRVELGKQAARLEAQAAQAIIDDFIAKAREKGLDPVPLRARTMDGHLVRTDKHGWYIRQNHSLAIDTDGGYQVLTVPGGWRERITGVKLTASLPSLEVGRGGRDGETGSLREFLGWVLDGQVPQE
ncbi:hypothetical protein FOJ82_13635 [Tessaracoccus rhinocerotis]|uniref:Uncharacterized protein n=1 Tax=Tessaracoccus rhinocerotis TaxID=1689449 RepID=A0A553JWU3_9ACTN|nr:hypothetical protein [Tessaracoccus rhinocerotis]TRY16906.1 hypothetical protein FOJ82_13635 [Tessaracoccus rhinocerotis]